MSKIALQTQRPEKKERKEVLQGLGQRFPCITWRNRDKGCSQAAHGASHTTEGGYDLKEAELNGEPMKKLP